MIESRWQNKFIIFLSFSYYQSHIGTALFPRAIFAAVPRSPEPPQPARAPTPTQNRPPSALSTAIMDATMIGGAVGE